MLNFADAWTKSLYVSDMFESLWKAMKPQNIVINVRLGNEYTLQNPIKTHAV